MLTQTIEKSYKHKACIIVIIIKASYILQHIYVVQNTKLKQRKNKQRIQALEGIILKKENKMKDY